jgi:hypothetical protein
MKRNARALGLFTLVAGTLTGLIAHGAIAGHATSPPVDPRSLAVAHSLGLASVPSVDWRSVDSSAGARYQAHVPGIGIVEVDPVTHELDEVVYDAALARPTGETMSADAAYPIARAFAARHFGDFDRLVSRSSETVDHGVFSEVRITWQARAGSTWLPIKVVVGVNSRSGRLAYYWSERIPTWVGTVPKVTAAQAIADALSAAGVGSNATADTPSLEVMPTASGEHLVWITEVTKAEPTGFHVPQTAVVWVDAVSGQAQVVARS